MHHVRTARRLAMFGALAFVASACSFIVSFVEKDVQDCMGDGNGGGCSDAQGAADSTVPPTDGAAPDAPADSNPCTDAAEGTLCGHRGCTCAYCAGGTCSRNKECPLGFNWDPSEPLARCCDGGAVLTNTRENCGVCGFRCVDAQACEEFTAIGRHFCTGCDPNSDCPSGCCSHSPAPNHCAPSICASGTCNPDACPAPSECVTGPPNYCAYK